MLIYESMSPRPAPDLDLRRDRVIRAARDLAESEGWAAVTMRRLAGALGATQPVLYSAFAGRQAVIDAVAVNGFGDLAAGLEAVDASPMARMRAYLDFAAAQPRVYEAMFSLPSGLRFAADTTPGALHRASWPCARHSRTPTAPGQRSPGRRCMAWPPCRPAGACARATCRPGCTSSTTCSHNRHPNGQQQTTHERSDGPSRAGPDSRRPDTRTRGRTLR